MNLRQYARAQECMIRLPGCSFDTDETVLAHIRLPGTGIGTKELDIFGAWACDHCHSIVDGRRRLEGWTTEQIQIAFFEGILRTQAELKRYGVLRW